MILANTNIQTNENNQSHEAFNKLNKVWRRVERKQARNAKLKREIEDFYNDFSKVAGEKEARFTQASAQLVEHLTQFISRKSLSEARRICLIGWIESEIEDIESNPFSGDINTRELRLNVHDQIAALVNNDEIDSDEVIYPEGVRDLLENMLEMEIDLSDDELVEMASNPGAMQDYIERKLSDIEQEAFAEEDLFDDEDIFGSDDPFTGSQYQQHNFESESILGNHHNNLFKRSQTNKMYKKLAQILHPDKEQDEDKKLEKQTLMQQLSTAKKQNDVFTIFTLYSQFVPDAEINLDDESISALTLLLYRKLDDLDDEREDMTYEDTPQNLVWRRFANGSKKQIKATIKSHVEMLTVGQIQMLEIINECTNLKVLNRLLAERQAQQKIEEQKMLDELAEEYFFEDY
ncbi:hypothetical protein [Catenovulum sediminis]|uniref:J domain-containing protein n=1 Tax=Catenovulum sediminis TaxID=1740262 RepID=A0ABV1RIW6_9ALTE